MTDTNGTALAVRDTAAIMERAVIQGDLTHLTPGERVDYYARLCSSLKLNPYSKPFRYLELNAEGGGKQVVLYASRDCTDQLRSVHRVSITRLERERQEGLFIVTAYASLPDGRTDSAVGAVPIVKENGEWKASQNGKRYFESSGTFSPLTGDALANAIMKAETKAKRRVTLSICGLGMTDESEVESIPGARVIEAEYPDAEMVTSADHRIWKRWLEVKAEAQSLGLRTSDLTLPIALDELKERGARVFEGIEARKQQLAQEDAERAAGAAAREDRSPAAATGEQKERAGTLPSVPARRPSRTESLARNRELIEKARELGVEGGPALNVRADQDAIESANEELARRIAAEEARLLGETQETFV